MDAVLLTGGRAARMGGADKPSLEVGGVGMAARVARAVQGAGRLVVVGPDPGLAGAVVTCEDPPGSGPLAAVAAALAHVDAPEVVVLATDLPFVTAGTVARLADALAADPAASVAMAVDDGGRDQPLLAVWRTAALRTAVAAAGPPAGLPLKALTAAAPGPVVRVATDPAAAGGGAPAWFDCDTPADLERARSLARQEAAMSNLDAWMDAVVAELGLAGAVDRDGARPLVLDLARDVAHAVERPAAPLTAFLAGLAAGRSADPIAAAPAVAERIAALLRRWPAG